jgi:hypothetical protein
LPGYLEILLLWSILYADGRPIGNADAGRTWHTDLSYTATPSRGSQLYAVEISYNERAEALGDTLFVRYGDTPRPWVRYLATASSWMYLVHLPLTIWIPGFLAPVALPALVKGAIVLGVTGCLTLWTYDRFVRSTAVGALLNGPRYPSGLARSGAPSLPSRVLV